MKALDANSRFRRDTGLGGIYHRGKISFREVARKDSLHVIVDGARVSVHVDEISPLICEPGGSGQYSLWGVVAHNVSGIWADVNRRIRGRHGAQRCNLNCEVVWVDDDEDGDGDEAAQPVPVADCSSDEPHHHPHH